MIAMQLVAIEMEEQLTNACIDGDIEAVKGLIERGLSCRGLIGDETFLNIAIKNNHKEIAIILLENGALIDETDLGGSTALSNLAYDGNIDGIEFLINHEASLDIIDNDGNTAILWAAYSGQTNAVKLLLKHGALPDIPDSNGRTALIEASASGNIEIVNSLLNSGATIDLQSINGYTALLEAASNGHVDIVEMLINCGASLTNTHGLNAYACAALGSQVDVMYFLNKNILHALKNLGNVAFGRSEDFLDLRIAMRQRHGACVFTQQGSATCGVKGHRHVQVATGHRQGSRVRGAALSLLRCSVHPVVDWTMRPRQREQDGRSRWNTWRCLNRRVILAVPCGLIGLGCPKQAEANSDSPN